MYEKEKEVVDKVLDLVVQKLNAAPDVGTLAELARILDQVVWMKKNMEEGKKDD